MAHHINLLKLAFKQRLLKAGHGAHDGVVFRHDCLQPRCGDPEVVRVGVSQQLACGPRQLDVKRLLRQVGDLPQQEQELGVKVHVDDLGSLILVLGVHQIVRNQQRLFEATREL